MALEAFAGGQHVSALLPTGFSKQHDTRLLATGQWRAAIVASRLNRMLWELKDPLKPAVTNLIGPLKSERQKVCPITFQLSPPLFQTHYKDK